MNEPKLKAITSPIPLGGSTFVSSVSYDLNRLIVLLDADDSHNNIIEVIFDSPRAFRCLDEGDLCRYWTDNEPTPTITEVVSGGWLEFESKGHLEVTTSFDDQRKFLISGSDDCVSIITNKEPTIRVINSNPTSTA